MYQEENLEGEEEGLYEPPQLNPGMRQHEPRPVGQVHPAPRQMQKMGRGQPLPTHARRLSEEGLVRPPAQHRRPVMAGGHHGRSQIQNPGEHFQGEGSPRRMHQGQGPSMGRPLNPGMDISKLGRKLGGQISITSSDQVGANRRPLPSPNQNFKPEMSGQHPVQSFKSEVGNQVPARSTPPQSRPPIQNQAAQVQVKEEPVEEDFVEDEDLEEGEEDFEEEEFERDGDEDYSGHD